MKGLPSAGQGLHAEMNCSQRLYEYILPLALIVPPEGAEEKGPTSEEIDEICGDAAKKMQVLSMSSEEKQEVDSREGEGEEDGDEEDAIEDQYQDRAQGEEESGDREIKYRRRLWCRMEVGFPAETALGRARVEFFRKLKKLLKYVAGRRSFHNFVTGGGSPDEPTVKRRLDRIFHKDILTDEDGEQFAVFSISGDGFVRGQIRKVLGTVLSVMRGWLPVSYIDALLSDDDVYDAPSVPGWPLFLAESKYDR